MAGKKLDLLAEAQHSPSVAPPPPGLGWDALYPLLCSLLRPQVLPSSLPWCCDTNLGSKPNLLPIYKTNSEGELGGAGGGI